MPVEQKILIAVIVAAVFAAGYGVYWLLGVLEEQNVAATGTLLRAAVVPCKESPGRLRKCP
jgi:hypothetical protein